MRSFFGKFIEAIKVHPVLAGILVTGFLLRLSGIPWGIPFPDPLEGDYQPDEWVVVQGAIQFPQHIVENLWLVYPTFFHYFLGLITMPLRLFFDAFGLAEPGNPGPTFYYVVKLIGRLCSVFAGTATIVLTYLLAKDIFDQKRAVLASAFLALTLYHVSNSSFTTTDVLTSFFFVLFLIVLRRAFLTPEIATPFVFAGITLGLLIGTKYTGAIAGLAIVVMYGHAMVQFRHSPPEGNVLNRKKLHRHLLLCGVVTIATFFLTTPGPLLHFDAFLDSMLYTINYLDRFTMPRSEFGTWVVVFQKIVVVMGLPLASVFLMGVFIPYKKNVYEWSYLAILVGFFGYFGATLFERYIILVAPLMALVASNGACWLYESHKKPVHFFGLSIITIVLVYSLGYSVAGVYLRYHDTRTEAGHYVHDNFPNGTTLGIAYTSEEYSWRAHSWKYPRIDLTRFKSKNFLDYPEVVIVSSGFHGKHIEEALHSNKLSKEFVWDERYIKEWWHLSPPSPRVFRFYDELFDPGRSQYTLLKTFPPQVSVPIEFASPEIKIYVHQSFASHRRQKTYSLRDQREEIYKENMWRRSTGVSLFQDFGSLYSHRHGFL